MTRTLQVMVFLGMLLACQEKVSIKQIEYPLSSWSKTLNNGSEILKSHYTLSAILLDMDGVIAEGNRKVAGYYQDVELKAIRDTTIFEIHANKDSTYSYQIRDIAFEHGRVLSQLQILGNGVADTLVELEFLADGEETDFASIKNQLSNRRKEWLELCNKHEIETLVNNAYSVSTMYYTHKPLIVGRNDLLTQYNYMNRENYSLHLEPMFIKVVNSMVVYEIGQCSGSYNGKYILIWKFEKDGVWRIIFDSNI